MIRPDLMHFGLSKISPSVGLRSMLRGAYIHSLKPARRGLFDCVSSFAWDALRGDVMIAVLQRI